MTRLLPTVAALFLVAAGVRGDDDGGAAAAAAEAAMAAMMEQGSLNDMMAGGMDDEEGGGDGSYPQSMEEVREQKLKTKRTGESIERRKAAAEARAIDFVAPSTANLIFAETFETSDVLEEQWVLPDNTEKYTGEWRIATRNPPDAIRGDHALRMTQPNRYYGISRSLESREFFSNDGKDLALSYEVRLDNPLECGGAYLKLFSQQMSAEMAGVEFQDGLKKFDASTRYSIMFGPDRCGAANNKVHLIIQSQNPATGEWTEHHLRQPPPMQSDVAKAHQYGFVLRHEDNSYEVLVDGKVMSSGSLLADFEPPFTPVAEIPDSSDQQPSDWVTDPMVADPSDVKPEDWDEDAPMEVEDLSAVMPTDWLLDEPTRIVDETATRPEEWDDEEDGEWQPPMIRNPVCTTVTGCGPWSPPRIANPLYRGKWTPRRIANPEYKGVWMPRNIPNPAYFKNENPSNVAPFDAVGFELWTIQAGVVLDNIVIARSKDAVMSFVDATWAVRSRIENEMVEAMREAEEAAAAKRELAAEKGALGLARQYALDVTRLVQKSPIIGVVAVGSVAVFVLFLFSRIIRRSGQKYKPSSDAAGAKKDDDKKPVEKKKRGDGDKEEDDEDEDDDDDDEDTKKKPSTTRKRRPVVAE